MGKLPLNIRYRGAVYTMLRYTYDDLEALGGVELGDAYDPQGKWYPGWADMKGHKYAEMEGYYIRVDDLDGWRWEWMEGANQDSVAYSLGNERFLPK